MAVRIGILGLGFMGQCHFATYAKIPGAQVRALCDVDPAKRAGDWSATQGNIGGAGSKVNLSGVRVYSDAAEMLAAPDLDVIDITLPTYLHAAHAVAALNAGKHVICEKPMALTSAQARAMLAAANKAKRHLYVAHCIRFWPLYARAREFVRNREYGACVSATFRRVSARPLWSWSNWLQDLQKSGDCALDLHIHDADFVLYCFGPPRAVRSHVLASTKGRAEHILTQYVYGPRQWVTAEGAWEYHAGLPFSMGFTLAFERATLATTPALELMLYPANGQPEKVPLAEGDGYLHELRHFIACLAEDRDSDVVPPQDACRSVRLVELELQSARTGRTVPVKL